MDILKIFIDTNVIYHSMDYKLKLEDLLDSLISRRYEIIVHSSVLKEIELDLEKEGRLYNKAKFAKKYIEKIRSIY